MEGDRVFLTRSLCMNRNPQGAIVGIKGVWLGAIIPIRDGEEIVIGRAAGMCDLVLPEKVVSRRHCSIVYHESTGDYSVWDWSSNGTFLRGGKRLERNREYTLKTGAELLIGSRDNVFKLG